MKQNACCFTGHREIAPRQYFCVKYNLIKIVEQLYKQGVTEFYAGGALGFDTVAAQTVLAFKKEYSDIKLHLILPCKEQADKWPQTSKEIYNEILKQADDVTYVSEHYSKYCMQNRNRMLVDSSGICVCYLEKNFGGTAYTVNYAKKKNLQIINIIK